MTPNMHLHGHLTECVQDYGPTFGFWLYSFERYNEMLGKFPNNQKHIEIQLMKRFETEMQLHTLPLPQMFHNKIFHLLEGVTGGVFDEDNCLDYTVYQIQTSERIVLFYYLRNQYGRFPITGK